MSLLLVNQQISAEARELLYGGSSFTVSISDNYASFLQHRQFLKDFKPFMSTHSINYIKNWQFDLQFDASYDDYSGVATMLAPHLRSPLDDDRYYIREGLLAVSAVLARKSTDLQTLKIRVPCLCKKLEGIPDRRVRNAITFSLEPLKLLRFNGSVTMIAAQYENKHDGKGWVLKCGETTDTQCQEKACLAFTDSFADMKNVFQDQSVPPLLLTRKQKQWLDLKQRSAELLPWTEPQTRFNLLRVWTAMERCTDEEFDEKIDTANVWLDVKTSS